MDSQIEIYQTPDNQTRVEVRFEADTVWLTQAQLVELFRSSKANISEHIKAIYQSGELQPEATVRKFRTVRQEGKRSVTRDLEYYNLDMIISIGYRVNTRRGIQFRQWATQRLKEYLVQGYAINEKRLAEKQMQIEVLQSGIRILHRAIEEHQDKNALSLFAAGLELLDQYDHQSIRATGTTTRQAVYPALEDYLQIINSLKPEFASAVFAVPKDQSAVTRLEDIHLSQAMNYCQAYQLPVGLLINFGAKSLEFKRVYNLNHPENQEYIRNNPKKGA